MKRPDGSLQGADVADADACPLGQWLQGPGRRFAGTLEYDALVVEHARYHRHAADLVLRANAGQRVMQHLSVSAASPYVRASKNVIALLAALRGRVARVVDERWTVVPIGPGGNGAR